MVVKTTVTRRVIADGWKDSKGYFLGVKVSVFVLDRSGRPLMPCSQKRARKLLAQGRARVHRLIPFVIRVVDRQIGSCTLQPLRIKIDPGSKASGMALVRDAEQVDSDTGEVKRTGAVLSLMELVHRGRQISEKLTARRNMRRRRRGNLCYRSPRFLNRTKPKEWLAPSLQHRVDTTKSWVQRLQCWAPITAISFELVRFDMQLIQNPEISLQGLSHRHCRLTQRADGYGYFFNKDSNSKVEKPGRALRAALSLPGLKVEVSRAN